MGRKSKRKAASANVLPYIKKVYQAGVYTRLSSNNNNKITGSEPLEIQERICRKFVEDFNNKGTEIINIKKYYKDLGKTGTNYKRNGFMHMMQDIRLGEINCIIVKDLSRFGRNYLEAGNYIEKIFPFLGIRFIAVTDGIDTGMEEYNIDYISLEIKNLANEMYAKEFSVKSKTSLKQRRKQGSYTGGPPPYGYITIWEGEIRKLVPDKNTAAIIEYIFKNFIEEKKYKAVTDNLNKKRINPPVIYKKTKQVICPCNMEYKKWNKNAVIRILKNRTYTGILEQGKTSITMRDEHTRVKKDKAEWIIKENSHKPLVSQELFENATLIASKISRKRGT